MTIFPATPGGLPIQPGLAAGIPVGSIIAFAVPLVPPGEQGPGNTGVLLAQGWMPCDGRTLDASQYPELFAVLGYAFGGSGERFQVPDYRGEPQPGAGQAKAGTLGVQASHLIRFTQGGEWLQPVPPAPLVSLARSAVPGHALVEQPLSPEAPQVAGASQATAGAAAIAVDPPGAIAGEPVAPGQAEALEWHATPAYAFTFALVYGEDGRFETLRCSMLSKDVHFHDNGYLLPLSLKTQDAAGKNVDIRMALTNGQGPYERGVWCRIEVPQYRFEGIAFVFSDDVNGPAPLTIW